MRCKQARRLFSAHLDGELAAGQEEQFRAHLVTCPECKTLLEKVSGTIAALRDLPEQALSKEERGQIHRSWRSKWKDLSRGAQPASRGLARTATALGAAMVLGAAAVISLSVLHHPQEVGENAASTEAAAESDTGSDRSKTYTGHQDLSTSLTLGERPLPQVVSSTRAVGAADMEGYGADYAQKQSFYSAVWQHSAEKARPDAAPVYDLEALGKLQAQCAEDMVEAAESLGEDASVLRNALNSVLAASADQLPLLPCWAEKVVFEGKAAWIISLSGPQPDVSQGAGTGTPQGAEQPVEGGEGLVGSKEILPALPRYLFVVNALDFQILFR